MMIETVDNKLDLKKPAFNEIKNGENLSLFPQINRNNYNIKDQLEELLGPTDFKTSLEKVNLSVGIFISVVLLLFFFI